MTWTQPVCENKYRELYGPDSMPHRIKHLPRDQWDGCCFCNTPTNIYVRLDPTTVPHPREN